MDIVSHAWELQGLNYWVCTLGCICEGPESCCALESTRIMAVWAGSMVGRKASAWWQVMAQSQEGKQEVMNSDLVSARTAGTCEGYSWKVKPFWNPRRKAKPVRCRANEQCCYRGASPSTTNHSNVALALRMNFTNIPFTQQSDSCPKPSSASVPLLSERQLPLFPWTGN